MRRAAAAAILVACAAALSFADRETAKFLGERGEKALAAKDWAGAAGHYRKALAEDATFLPAQFGLGEALVGLGQRDEAIAEFRAFAGAAKALSPLPDGWGSLLQRAEKRLAQFDAAGTELRTLVDRHAAALLSLARKWAKDDPDLAVRAARRALALRPGDAAAAQLIESLGRSPKGEPIALFDGASLAGWIEAVLPTWSVREGAIEGECRDSAYAARTERHFEGDFDVRCEARLLESHEGSGPVFWGVSAAYDGKESGYLLGVLKGALWFEEERGADEALGIVDASPSTLEKPFDPKKWHALEVRLRGGRATALVQGEEVGSAERSPARAGGFVGLKVQNCRVQFRKIEVVPR